MYVCTNSSKLISTYTLSHAFELVDWGEKMDEEEEEELQCHFLSYIIGMEYGGGGR